MESVWDYPRPPRVELCARRAAVELGEVTVADSYPQRVDLCRLGDERVEPNEGDFYGGWITVDLEGPFKGATGSTGC